MREMILIYISRAREIGTCYAEIVMFISYFILIRMRPITNKNLDHITEEHISFIQEGSNAMKMQQSFIRDTMQM